LAPQGTGQAPVQTQAKQAVQVLLFRPCTVIRYPPPHLFWNHISVRIERSQAQKFRNFELWRRIPEREAIRARDATAGLIACRTFCESQMFLHSGMHFRKKRKGQTPARFGFADEE
jgi:hypothetical protein